MGVAALALPHWTPKTTLDSLLAPHAPARVSTEIGESVVVVQATCCFASAFSLSAYYCCAPNPFLRSSEEGFDIVCEAQPELVASGGWAAPSNNACNATTPPSRDLACHVCNHRLCTIIISRSSSACNPHTHTPRS